MGLRAPPPPNLLEQLSSRPDCMLLGMQLYERMTSGALASPPALLTELFISFGDGTNCANFVRFRGSQPLLPHLCLVSVPKGGGGCGAYSESL